jgi:Xaa-Pro aminopeptidase
MNPTAEKLALLRDALHQNSIDAYIIPSTDPHLGEEVPGFWRIIEWLSGFTGSSGTIVVTESFAGLWTDSRYFIQAEKELLNSVFSFIRPELGQWDDYTDFLLENLSEEEKIGLDGRLFSIKQIRKLQKQLERKKIKADFSCDLIQDIWPDRPSLPSSPAFDHPVGFSGKERAVKIDQIRAKMKIKSLDWQLLCSPDDIMWLLNIRGNDLKYTPVLFSFALVGPEQILLFTDETKIPPKTASDFDKLGIVILPYEETSEIISSVTGNSSVLIDPATTSFALYNSVSVASEIIEDISIPSQLKAVKNKTEIENLNKVMIADGVALVKLFYWFESCYENTQLIEKDLADKLLDFRSLNRDFLGLSFETIAASGKNSALPHYSPTSGSGFPIDDNNILLIDSGGQYMGGTTDITRTISTGMATAKQKKDFTLVLKGHIGLAMAKFPAGTMGYQLDILARRALWNSGLNFGHGTGHGVGFCLNVHEGPQSISPAPNLTAIEPGMLISNEPAIYREEEYGIRTENLILCYEDEETEFGRFLKFDTISLCYIEKSLIEKSLLDQNEVKWLNSYHSTVFEKLSPHLSAEEKSWLKEKTEKL